MEATPPSVLISQRHRTLAVPALPEIINVFPNAPTVTWEGNNLAVVPHDLHETLFLRQLGYDVPAPVLFQYDWNGGQPFEVQRRTAALLTTSRRAYVLNGMGTGKTKAALWAWHYLRGKGHAGKLLVVAPLSTLNFTWGREIFQTLPGTNIQILHGAKAKRLLKLDDREADIYIVNHDGLAIIEEALAQRPDIDTFVLDELAVYRNAAAVRSKVVKRIAARMKWAWGMTGSPTPNEPTDAWGQCAILTPHTVPKHYNRFRDQLMTKVSQFRWVPKPDAVEKVFQVMQPAVRFTLDDVVELPELIERTVEVEMGPKQAKVYKQMEDHAHSLIASQEITAMNAGAVLNKLLQISLGYVYTREQEVVELDNEERLRTITDIVNSTDRKVIVFAPFVHALQGIAGRLTSEGYDVRTISGSTPKGERDETFNLFQNTTSVKAIVAHPQTMSHGLTLTAADTILWAGPTSSLETFLQANARIRRVGQKHKQQIIMLHGSRVEKKAYQRLRAKEQVQGLLLDMFEEASES